MKHSKKQLKKIDNETIKKGVTTLVILFFVMVILLLKDSPNTQLQFVRNSDESGIHGAANDNPPASQRDYLFQNDTGNPEYQGSITKGTTQTSVINTPITDMPKKDNIDKLVNPDEVTQAINNISVQTGQLYTGTINTGIQSISKPDTNIIKSYDCTTPWNEKVMNDDFVLGYEQRTDVNTICNVQKRVCTNGVLGGTFAQRSCKDNVVYDYKKANVVSYNQKVLNDYIQPTAPANAGAEFNNQGKINAATEKPTDTRGTTNKPVTVDQTVTQNSGTAKADCTTPRNQTIKHGQFIKAYKTPRGFVDMQCEVEIRPCVNGSLKGSFIYPKCTFSNITYNDYLQGKPKAFDQPTIQDLSQSITQDSTQTTEKSFRSFDRIKSVFK